MTTARPAAVIVLAAGEGTRMKSADPQGPAPDRRPHPARPRPRRRPRHRARAPGRRRAARARPGRRARRRGRPRAPSSPTRTTSRAPGAPSECALDALPADLDGTVLVTYGDVPLLTGETPARPARGARREPAARSTVLTADAAPTRPATAGSCATPTARSPAIVEQKDATAEQRAIREINSGIFAFDAAVPARGAGPGRHRQRPGRVLPHRRRRASPARDGPAGRRAPASTTCWQTEGVNDRVQLARLGAELNRRIVERLDARRRDGHRPRHHLDRRRRDASAAT